MNHYGTVLDEVFAESMVGRHEAELRSAPVDCAR